MTIIGKLSVILEAIKPTPTKEMVAFYKERTDGHVNRVKDNMVNYILKSRITGPEAAELKKRGEDHDKSKYLEPEYTPYLWLTEYHRQKNVEGKKFKYPPGIKVEVDAAVKHHLKNNRHHPAFHKSPSDMSKSDIIEMVCDWAAMSQELAKENWKVDLKKWADDHVGAGKEWNFTKDQTKEIYNIIKVLGE